MHHITVTDSSKLKPELFFMSIMAVKVRMNVNGVKSNEMIRLKGIY